MSKGNVLVCPTSKGFCVAGPCISIGRCARAVDRNESLGEATEAVDHPKHYNAHPSGIECIAVVEHMGFNLGNAMKYIWRCDEKRDAIEDLKKARWYVEREIEKRLKERGAPVTDWDVAKA
jgi:hypothetical protein